MLKGSGPLEIRGESVRFHGTSLQRLSLGKNGVGGCRIGLRFATDSKRRLRAEPTFPASPCFRTAFLMVLKFNDSSYSAYYTCLRNLHFTVLKLLNVAVPVESPLER